MIGLFGLLAACGPSAEEDEAALRDAMRPAVFKIIAQTYPLAPPVPLTNCIVEHAMEAERFRLAEASVQGATGSDTNLVRVIVSRSGTRDCLFDAGLNSDEYGW